MSIFKVVIVLGKRLVNDQLTAEGISRVEALLDLMPTLTDQNCALVFCGGVLEGQSVSEAKAMHDYFKQLYLSNSSINDRTVLEDRSLNTVENISNAADKLIESQLCQIGQEVEFLFVSNDYHLERVFEIQHLLDEQGLLRVLKSKCQKSGLRVNLDYDLNQHCVVPYPHSGEQAEGFLAVDALTTYRVYLEGVNREAFQRDLELVRREPFNIAMAALSCLKRLDISQAVQCRLARVESIIRQTTPGLTIEELTPLLVELDTHLKSLNRYFDPEQTSV